MTLTPEQYYTVHQAAASVATIPHNSGGAFMRSRNYDVDVWRFGDNCYGKLLLAQQGIPPDVPISYYVTQFRSLPHIAAVIDQEYYLDPTLNVLGVIPFSRHDPQGVFMELTTAANQLVEAHIPTVDTLDIRLWKISEIVPSKILDLYHYNLWEGLQEMPAELDVISLSEPFTYAFISPDGYHIKSYYDHGKREWKSYCLNSLDNSPEINPLDYFRWAVVNLYGITVSDLEDYFNTVTEIVRLTQYWHEHQHLNGY